MHDHGRRAGGRTAPRVPSCFLVDGFIAKFKNTSFGVLKRPLNLESETLDFMRTLILISPSTSVTVYLDSLVSCCDLVLTSARFFKLSLYTLDGCSMLYRVWRFYGPVSEGASAGCFSKTWFLSEDTAALAL